MSWPLESGADLDRVIGYERAGNRLCADYDAKARTAMPLSKTAALPFGGER
ncbi:hypothetical protein Natoc_1677 [Natronococcus occultus SP4]|uniref:Uncharacterized protein n=2 Tax=Natronococcus occultus TaxID=29288 RepID=L0JWS3_9EURY|nr:hypothetical protein Natoc_1677 [Natronococcus occultus SP4]